ncbi:MAG: hypothetical protein PVG96_07935 [Desulfobacterales bacterium]
MEPSKKKPQPIEPLIEVSDSRKNRTADQPDVDAQVGVTEKTDIYEVSHRITEDKGLEDPKPVNKDQLINKLNFINFQDSTLLINFKHRNYNNTRLTLTARPQPCLGDTLNCVWEKSKESLQVLDLYEFQNILIPDNENLIQVEPELIRMNKEVICLRLPDYGCEISSRKVIRYGCQNIKAQLIQNSTLFSGALVDFNACSLKIELKSAPPQTFEWINSEAPVNLILSGQKETYYSGECQIIRQSAGRKTRVYILKPLVFEIQRFKHKEFRSQRYHLTPSPDVLFRHPFTNKMFDLKVVDLSGSGFAVEENQNNSVLLPGMILPALELSFANSFKIKCRAQVVYRKNIEAKKEGNWVKCGVALLDINIEDHVKLISILQQTNNGKSYFCNRVNLDDLWNFFFETGFIYPDKYKHIQKNKQQIKATYEKLYNNDSNIARHFIYQDNGRIMGHMAMLRYYSKTWLIHHHAARKSALNKAGLIVLDQIGRMGNNSHQLDSLHMDYLICYYRPDNKFPSRVFGGAANSIHDPKGCSIDTFAYYRHQCNLGREQHLPESWQIKPASRIDLLEFENYYQHVSSGLMLDAADLRPNHYCIDSLSEEYKRLELQRDRRLFALRQEDQLKALFVVNLTDLGLNLSDLTNCIKVFVIDQKALSAKILTATLDLLATRFKKTDLPVLIYPVAFADQQAIAYEKCYNLWALSMQFTDQYFKYINRLLRFL